MASYNPPTETLAIFDPSVFAIADIPLTQAQADARYLRFPTAQGTENLAAINVNGVATFNSGVNFASTAPPTSSQTIPASNDSSTKIPTTAWVQSAITAGSSNTLAEVLVAGNNAGSQDINMNNQNISGVNTISFATTSQNTAYTGAPAGTYTDTNMTIDANGKITAISSGTPTSSVLTGTIVAFAGNSVPTGYLLCDSTQYSTTTYPALFALLGYTYGGTGAFFNVPNLINNFIKGATQSVGATESGLFTISNSNIQSATITSTDLGGGAPYVAFNTSSGISNWTYYKGKASGDGSVNVWTPVTTSTGTRGGTDLVSAFNTTIGTATPTPLTGNVPNYLMRYIIKT
jgi:microcystin-dependent protein